MRLLSPPILKELYFLSFTCTALGLPLGRALISIGFIAISACWIIEKLVQVSAKGWLIPFKEHWEKLKKDPVLLAILSVFLVHLIFLINTQNFEYAQNDLKTKLPLFFIPIIASTLPRLSKQRFFLLLHIFITGVFISSVLSYINHLNLDSAEVRDSILFVSHIRLALMVVLSIFIMIYHLPTRGKLYRAICVMVICWFLIFMNWMQAATGVGVLILIILFSLIMKVFFLPKGKLRSVLISALGLLMLGLVFLGNKIYKEYSYISPLMTQELEEKSADGEPYFHDIKNLQKENGFYIWRSIADHELREGWNQRSRINFDSNDVNGNKIKGTLIRYLNSKGLKKDGKALDKLDESDINNIEKGIANYLYPEMSGMNKRLSMLVFELDAYANGMDPSGNSLTQRFEFWKTGFTVFSENLWTGVGTGDVADAFAEKYESDDSTLSPKFRLRGHNQYLTFLLTFGIFGGMWVITMFFIPIIYHSNNFLFICFSLIVLLGFITEDMLETQAGVSFYVFFLMTFLWLSPKPEEANRLDFKPYS